MTLAASFNKTLRPGRSQRESAVDHATGSADQHKQRRDKTRAGDLKINAALQRKT
jgi:hypothetical protein